MAISISPARVVVSTVLVVALLLMLVVTVGAADAYRVPVRRLHRQSQVLDADKIDIRQRYPIMRHGAFALGGGTELELVLGARDTTDDQLVAGRRIATVDVD